MNSEIPQKKENFFKEIIKFTVIALIIVIPIRTYVAQPFIVDGPSMDPTFNTGHYLIIDQLTYNFSNPKRLDVIVFRYPNNPKVFFIKRIIGLPGETISGEAGKIKITNKDNPDGFLLKEDYIANNHRSSESFVRKLGDDEYFVMGDNRAESSDSRIWGPLEERYVVGRAWLRLIPLTKISVFPGN